MSRRSKPASSERRKPPAKPVSSSARSRRARRPAGPRVSRRPRVGSAAVAGSSSSRIARRFSSSSAAFFAGRAPLVRRRPCRNPLVDLLAQPRHLAPGDPAHAHGLDQLVDRAGRDALDVGFLDHRRQRLLRHPPRLQEPWKVTAAAQLRDAQLDGPSPRLPVPLAVAVALRQPLGALLAIAGAGQPAHLQLHQPLGGEADHLPQQIRVRGLLHERPQAHHLIGHRWSSGQVGSRKPDPTGKSPMTTPQTDQPGRLPTPLPGTRPHPLIRWGGERRSWSRAGRLADFPFRPSQPLERAKAPIGSRRSNLRTAFFSRSSSNGLLMPRMTPLIDSLAG
jgi:hypothetical protein